jgi:RNA recognition motif-containing protein
MWYYTFLEGLRTYFSEFGQVIDAVVMKDNATGNSRGFGFVVFQDYESVKKVFEKRPHVIDGKEVAINFLFFFVSYYECRLTQRRLYPKTQSVMQQQMHDLIKYLWEA